MVNIVPTDGPQRVYDIPLPRGLVMVTVAVATVHVGWTILTCGILGDWFIVNIKIAEESQPLLPVEM